MTVAIGQIISNIDSRTKIQCSAERLKAVSEKFSQAVVEAFKSTHGNLFSVVEDGSDNLGEALLEAGNGGVVSVLSLIGFDEVDHEKKSYGCVSQHFTGYARFALDGVLISIEAGATYTEVDGWDFSPGASVCVNEEVASDDFHDLVCESAIIDDLFLNNDHYDPTARPLVQTQIDAMADILGIPRS
ncbi:hypothetical protein A3709_19145 [Halioglobus sp. HI00S01]|uniref:hypothetical protein n=1 Tax=Halioglobus sp. HI00S01 TaxID=1822214 RepID=UPI0007C33966|nr:hypothetical protein [Halioglobus sp. HI00S01]KZX57742.1 hypothetical protein A3709_19145 [Halioglobus sp. HI00S01]